MSRFPPRACTANPALRSITPMTRTRPICEARGVVGWDIGGANIKVARVAAPGDRPADRPGDPPASPERSIRASVRAYELQRDPSALPGVLRALAEEAGAAG